MPRITDQGSRGGRTGGRRPMVRGSARIPHPAPGLLRLWWRPRRRAYREHEHVRGRLRFGARGPITQRAGDAFSARHGSLPATSSGISLGLALPERGLCLCAVCSPGRMPPRRRPRTAQARGVPCRSPAPLSSNPARPTPLWRPGAAQPSRRLFRRPSPRRAAPLPPRRLTPASPCPVPRCWGTQVAST